MTKTDIMRMARESGIEIAADSNVRGFFDCMERFANLVAAAQKEADAKLIEEYPYWIGTNAQREIAAAIRARGTT
jgi:hypothetical protein